MKLILMQLRTPTTISKACSGPCTGMAKSKTYNYNFTDCGGTYTNASGIVTSPSYPNTYPPLAHCIYLISQPDGTYVNISFIDMDVICQESYSTSDYIDIRDGSSEDSPLMMGKLCGNGSNVPSFIQTTQNHLRIR